MPQRSHLIAARPEQLDNSRETACIAPTIQPNLLSMIAFAAGRCDEINWLVELFHKAIVFECENKRQKQAMFLSIQLGTVLNVYAGRFDDAIQVWEDVASLQLPSSQIADDLGRPRIAALTQLSRLCMSRAFADPARAQEYVDKVRTWMDASLLNADGSRTEIAGAPIKLHLAGWYHAQGDIKHARSLAREDVIRGLDILSDDDPANDFDGFYILAAALRSVQDDRNHLAARHALRQYAEDGSAIPSGNKSNKFIPTDAFCSGLCVEQHKQWDDMMLCRCCPDVNLCQNCFTLFQRGELFLNVCHTDHEFLRVPTVNQSFIRGEVIVEGKVISLDEWVTELRKEWSAEDSLTPDGQQEVDHLGGLNGESPQVERKRDKFKRLFSRSKDQ